MDNKNHLGLDKFQVTIIKRNYASIKPLINKRNKVLEKISEVLKKQQEVIDGLQKEVSMYTDQISVLDKFTNDITKQACGIELSSEQCLTFMESPEKFTEYKKTLGLDNGLFDEPECPTPTDLDAEEDKDWEDKIESGELKEVV